MLDSSEESSQVINNTIEDVQFDIQPKKTCCPSLYPYYFVLRYNPTFAWLWLASVVSMLGDSFNYVGTVTLLHQVTDDGLALGLLLAVRLIPYFLWSPITGVVADRFSKKTIMIISDCVRGFAVLGFIIVALDNDLYILLYVIVFIQFSFSAFFEPAKGGLIQFYVHKDRLVVANTLASLTWSMVTVLGSALGGFVIATLGLYTCFIIDSGSYFISLFCLWQMHRFSLKQNFDDINASNLLETENEEEEENDMTIIGAFVQGIKNYKLGMMYLKGEPYLFVIAMVKGFSSLVWGAIDMINVRLAEDEFPINGSGAESLGILWAVVGLGSGLGSLIAEQAGGNNNLKSVHLTFMFSALIRTLSYFLTSWSPNIYVWIIANVLRTTGEGIAWVWSGSLLQMTVPKKLIGRVLAFELAICTFLQVLAFIGSGILLDYASFSNRATLLLFSIISIFASWYVIFFLTRNTDTLSQKYKIYEYTEGK